MGAGVQRRGYRRIAPVDQASLVKARPEGLGATAVGRPGLPLSKAEQRVDPHTYGTDTQAAR
ncbi:hypothetical protein [Streptomyces sp. CL12-4]|uniref:hypothetical protein n=1 Tax=Streptomyces sp. CL12-4 TaxID=2810306 RepID=UPI001EFB46BF|nr:hypothetical protein [Streptomyces sp. CL12-4]MCG8970517.1 hypothetical protein [Streptomyces sp. CL12-4]